MPNLLKSFVIPSAISALVWGLSKTRQVFLRPGGSAARCGPPDCCSSVHIKMCQIDTLFAKLTTNDSFEASTSIEMGDILGEKSYKVVLN